MADASERVAFLGLGIMGAPMAANLAKAGFELSVWNRTAEKAERFAGDHGGTAAATAGDSLRDAPVAITMLPDAPQVEEVLFGGHGLGAAELVIDMSTVAPSASLKIAERLAKEGVAFVDAPVTGSRPKAEAGTLTIMAGGTEEAVARARPLFDAMGERIVHVGPQGHGAMTKVIANTVTAINAAAIGEALNMARSAGVDLQRFLEVARAGSSGSTVLELKAEPMIEHDFEPLFRLDHMLKDVRHCIAEAKALGIELRLAEVAERMYAEAANSGHGDEDFAAVISVTEAAAKAGR
jgi:3-hydroxyisobutyrate dehydrogenase-like beta-hydroxyacid dehydrogenase